MPLPQTETCLGKFISVTWIITNSHMFWNSLDPNDLQNWPTVSPSLNFDSILIDSRIHLEAFDGGSRGQVGHPQCSLQITEVQKKMGPWSHYANALFLCHPLPRPENLLKKQFFNIYHAGDAACTPRYKQVRVTCQFKLHWSWGWGSQKNFSIPSNHNWLCDDKKVSKTWT